MIFKIRRRVKWIFCILKYLLVMPIAILLRKSKGYANIWLISERGTDARDNGYHFFKYLRENHPEINAVYLITEKSPDRIKVASIGKVVNTGSIEHYLYFIVAQRKISTHIMGYAPDTVLFKKLDKLGWVKGKKVFLQHGITKDNISSLHYPNIKLDLFVCGAKPEYDFIKDSHNFNNGIVKYLGLSRFDELYNLNIKRQILIMPTWRASLSDCHSVEEFRKTKYFIAYNQLLNNPKLQELLGENDYELFFYPHYEIQKFIDVFKSSNNKIKIASFNNYDVQELLKESAVLITDYSSVFFDFAYMNKPIVYYQFDYDEFRKTHYSEGYFNYKKNGFGPIVNTMQDLIFETEQLLKNECNIDILYKNRINNFFPLHDQKNCERNFEAINAL